MTPELLAIFEAELDAITRLREQLIAGWYTVGDGPDREWIGQELVKSYDRWVDLKWTVGLGRVMSR